MTRRSTARLAECLARYRQAIPALADLTPPPAGAATGAVIAFYETCYPALEQALWSGMADFDRLLACYQGLFREQETLLRQQAADTGTPDDRYRFIISIPVADRPAHLQACLESILTVCETFGYGGMSGQAYTHITVVIAEDSREPDSIRRHIELAEDFCRRGLRVIHFGQDEQYALLQAIPDDIRARLGNLLSTQPRERFWLKGQAANRNLSVLKCLQLTADRERTLYYFVDSDETFCVNRATAAGDVPVYALNYFHALDRIFRSTGTLVLTGRMVGDPPVSPSVMAANFLDDITAFFTRLAAQSGSAACTFHGQSQATTDRQRAGAIYHDMAGLFGFAQRADTFPYRCPLTDVHDHAACLRTLAGRLAAFFFGEHLTRKTLFDYGDGFSAVTPARTVYPGNTVTRYAGLKYIIPFGHLRLRMSGPTAGRLIAAELQEQFVAANLPHLHRRTNDAGLDGAFRPGVARAADSAREAIDLSDEFERQFFGDLMLFTAEALAGESAAGKPFAHDDVVRVMERRERELLALYAQKHDAIRERSRQLDALVFRAGHWWLHDPELAAALHQVRAFLDNIDRNFGAQAPAWQQIRSADHRAARKAQLTAALVNYRHERDAWDSLFR